MIFAGPALMKASMWCSALDLCPRMFLQSSSIDRWEQFGTVGVEHQPHFMFHVMFDPAVSIHEQC